MSYTKLIDNSLKLAFTALKDLAIDGTFTRTNTTSFNFQTNTASSTTTSVTSKIVITDITKRSENKNSKMKQLLVKSKDIGDIKAYDSVLISGESWRIGPVINDSGFIYSLEIYKED
jgi:hypothetical protein